MLRSYFKAGLRNLRKHPVFSAINIAGLAIGLSAFWLLALYIGDELSYDRYHKNGDRVYRVVHHADWVESKFDLAPTSAPFGPTMKAEYPEIEAFARISPEGGGTLTVGEKSIRADDIMFSEPAFFSLFSFDFIAGDTSGFAAPQSIVLTRTLAEKLFGSATAAVGKTVFFENNFPNSVTAVIEDVPVNSHLRFSALRSLPQGYTSGWQAFNLYTYIMLRHGTGKKALEAKFPAFFKKHIEPEMGQGIRYRMELQPLRSIHLNSALEYEMAANGKMQYVYIFAIIGLLVLIIASINYMNLATARASYRVREIGVRKVIGSGKMQLVAMFLSESILITLIAGSIAVLIATMAMPVFNDFTGKSLQVWRFGVLPTTLILFVFTVIIGLLSGAYPAFFLSGFLTIPSLKGQLGSRLGTAIFRKTLVSFQFVITIIMIAGSIIIYRQLEFVRSKDLGLNKDHVLTFHIGNTEVRNKIAAIRESFLRNPLIEGVSAASNPIGNNNIGAMGYYFEQESSDTSVPGAVSPVSRKTINFMVDGNFVSTLGIKIAAGRSFSDNRPDDQFSSVLVNETLVKELGWKQPIGKRVDYRINQEGKLGTARVVGVVKDFHIYSLQHKLEPLILHMPPEESHKDNLYVRVSGKNMPAALEFLRKSYKQFDPAAIPEFHFLGDNFSAQYAAEDKQGRLLITFTLLAISIACLGLFGLVTFTAMQKSKEIGVRKVLGASVLSIVKLLSLDLLKLVVIAFAIAVPVSWFLMRIWLEDFAYQLTIDWKVFAAAGFIAVTIALLTMCVQAIRSALINPVRSLKSE